MLRGSRDFESVDARRRTLGTFGGGACHIPRHDRRAKDSSAQKKQEESPQRHVVCSVRTWLLIGSMLALGCVEPADEGGQASSQGPADEGSGAKQQATPSPESGWVRELRPPNLEPVSLEPYSIQSNDEGYLVRLGEVVVAEFASGELQCAAHDDLLACVYVYLGGIQGLLLSGSNTVPLHVRQSFFDEREVHGPPRWTGNGRLWLHLGDRWERRALGWPRRLPLDSESRTRAIAALRSRLPRGVPFHELMLQVPALQSAPLDASDAEDLWGQLRREGVVCAVAPERFAQDSADRNISNRVLESFVRADVVPVDAIYERLENARREWDERVAEEAPEYTGDRADRALLYRVRAGVVPPLPPIEGSLSFADRAAQMGHLAGPLRYRVLVADGDDEASLLLALAFGNFNDNPLSFQHAVLVRDWRAHFGARVFSVSHNTLELAVEHPPQDFQEAYELGWRHYLYDRDLQGLSMAARAAREHRWVFWWD